VEIKLELFRTVVRTVRPNGGKVANHPEREQTSISKMFLKKVILKKKKKKVY